MPMLEADRFLLADYLDALSEDEWNLGTWCPDWSVNEVAAHILILPTTPKDKLMAELALAKMNLNKMQAKLVEQMVSTRSAEDVADHMRSSASVPGGFPGKKALWITFVELLVHSTDISEAVGRPLDIPTTHFVEGADFAKGLQPVLASKKRIAGLQIKASDASWSTGEGPLVEGPAKYILSAMTGRSGALDYLTGDGLDTLRSRCS